MIFVQGYCVGIFTVLIGIHIVPFELLGLWKYISNLISCYFSVENDALHGGSGICVLGGCFGLKLITNFLTLVLWHTVCVI